MSMMIKGDTFAEVYTDLLGELHDYPEYESAPRGMLIREHLNVHLSVTDPLSNMFKNPVRSTPKKYLAGELLWYFSGRNDVEFISKYSKFWEKIANSDGTCNSAYGYQLWGIKNEFGYTEWQWALGSLLNDKDTRQAIVRFNKPMHSFDGNRDFVCTLNGVFQIRDDKLNLFISMRSSDAIKGLTFDFPFFSLLQQMMRLQLLNEYPDLEIGSLDMVLNSSHIYESDFELVNNMLDAADIDYFEADALPVANADLIGMSVEDILSANDPLSKWIQENA